MLIENRFLYLLYHSSSCVAVLDQFFHFWFDVSWVLNPLATYLLIVQLNTIQQYCFLVLSLSIISEALSEGLTFHSLALSQQVVTKHKAELFSLEILFNPWVLCPKVGNFAKVQRASPFTDGATGQYIQVQTAQLHSNANNRCFIPVRGFTNHAVFNS